MSEKWIPIEVEGDHPHPAGVIQRVDEESFKAICNQQIPPQGLPLDFDHFGELSEEKKAMVREHGIPVSSKVAGWMKEFRVNVVDGVRKLFARTEMTPDGETALANGDYKMTSPVHPRHLIQHIGGNIVRILGIKSCALTNHPNISTIGAILNSEGAPQDDLIGESIPIEVMANSEHSQGENMERIAQILGCEATEDAIVAALEPMKNSVAEADAKAEAAGAIAQAAEAAKAESDAKAEAAIAELEAEKAKTAEAEAEKAAADKEAAVQAEVAKHPDLENAEAVADILRLDFDKGVAFLASLPKAMVNGKPPEENDDSKPVCIFK